MFGRVVYAGVNASQGWPRHLTSMHRTQFLASLSGADAARGSRPKPQLAPSTPCTSLLLLQLSLSFLFLLFDKLFFFLLVAAIQLPTEQVTEGLVWMCTSFQDLVTKHQCLDDVIWALEGSKKSSSGQALPHSPK